ncbi:SDR family oxidoreductase [Tersicoccus sp. MR15.9]|uniref:SDR family oxidoreductase n=1 Tax=Tersicoccus mangrovi TaxID=3121635 RepID=UPI002FE637F0
MSDQNASNQNDQTTLQNPVDQHESISPSKQHQDPPGLDSEMTPKADLGESTYTGSNRLSGRRALITGADSGIGAAVAIAFAREGADVALAYTPAEQSDAERIAGLVKDAGRTAVLLPGDLLDKQYRDGLVDDAAGQLGGLDILVNNAGKQVAVETLEELTDEQVEQTFAINIVAMYALSRAALKHLPAGGAIINTTSIQAYEPSPTLLDYAATKAAINAFTKGLAQQLAERGIRVNAVAPGPIWTPLQVSGGQPKDALPEFGKSTPLGRAGQPAELAPAYVFLASAESSYVLGETLNVNGGMPTP